MDKCKNSQINILHLLIKALPSGTHYFSCTNLKIPTNLMVTHGPAGKDAHATCFTSHFGSNTFGGIQGEFKSLDFCWRLVPK
jgi:hypothetical protein